MKLFLDLFVQKGVSCSIKPQQVTFVVPGVEKFDHKDISNFIQKAEDNLVGFSFIIQNINCSVVFQSSRLVFIFLMQDPALLEFAWVELLEKNKSVTPEELAEVFFFQLTESCPVAPFDDRSLLCR